MQYASILVQQLDTIGTDRFNAKQFARTYFVFFTLLPMLYVAIGRAFDYRKEDMPQYLAEAALGPFDSMPVTGGLLRVLVSRAIFNVYKDKILYRQIEKVLPPDSCDFGCLFSDFRI